MSKLTEYDICFATKEYLMGKGYRIVTWNPPGSQGTFTIPNPSKDPTYKGQTGSESPDLIAINNREILFVEAKDNVAKSFDDIKKLKQLLLDSKRKKLLFTICQNQMKAMNYEIDFNSLITRYGIAVPYKDNIIEKYHMETNLTIFTVKSKIDNWDNKIIDGDLNMNDVYEVKEETI